MGEPRTSPWHGFPLQGSQGLRILLTMVIQLTLPGHARFQPSQEIMSPVDSRLCLAHLSNLQPCILFGTLEMLTTLSLSQYI